MRLLCGGSADFYLLNVGVNVWYVYNDYHPCFDGIRDFEKWFYCPFFSWTHHCVHVSGMCSQVRESMVCMCIALVGQPLPNGWVN